MKILQQVKVIVVYGRYRIYSKDLDRQACSNSVDPDQTPQNAASALFANHPARFQPHQQKIYDKYGKSEYLR